MDYNEVTFEELKKRKTKIYENEYHKAKVNMEASSFNNPCTNTEKVYKALKIANEIKKYSSRRFEKINISELNYAIELQKITVQYYNDLLDIAKHYNKELKHYKNRDNFVNEYRHDLYKYEEEIIDDAVKEMQIYQTLLKVHSEKVMYETNFLSAVLKKADEQKKGEKND